MHATDEAGELDGLELGVDEVADGGCEGEAGGAGGEVGPVDVDGHCILVGWLVSDAYKQCEESEAIKPSRANK